MINNKRLKKVYVIILLFILIIIGNLGARAETLFNNIIMSKDKASAIYTIDDIPIAPGGSIQKEFYIKNDLNYKGCLDGFILNNFSIIYNQQEINNNLINYKDFNKYVKINIKYEDKYLLDNTLENIIDNRLNFDDDKKINLSPGEANKIDMTIYMDPEAGNSVEGLTANFDMNFIFSMEKDDSFINEDSNTNGKEVAYVTNKIPVTGHKGPFLLIITGIGLIFTGILCYKKL